MVDAKVFLLIISVISFLLKRESVSWDKALFEEEKVKKLLN